MTIRIQDIFITQPDKQLYTKEELFGLKLKNSFLKDITTKLNLNYEESIRDEGNLCFINNNNVRPEFRTTFTKLDIIYLINSVFQKTKFDLKTDEILFPVNVMDFWKLVEKGSY